MSGGVRISDEMGYPLFILLQVVGAEKGASKINLFCSGARFKYRLPAKIIGFEKTIIRALRDRPMQADEFKKLVDKAFNRSGSTTHAFDNFFYKRRFWLNALVGEIAYKDGNFIAYENRELANLIKSESEKRKYKLMDDDRRLCLLALFELEMELKLQKKGVFTKRVKF